MENNTLIKGDIYLVYILVAKYHESTFNYKLALREYNTALKYYHCKFMYKIGNMYNYAYKDLCKLYSYSCYKDMCGVMIKMEYHKNEIDTGPGELCRTLLVYLSINYMRGHRYIFDIKYLLYYYYIVINGSFGTGRDFLIELDEKLDYNVYKYDLKILTSIVRLLDIEKLDKYIFSINMIYKLDDIHMYLLNDIKNRMINRL